MKPWTERKQIDAALRNEGVRIGERPTPQGALRGVYAAKAFAPGDYVASFHGKIISRAQLFELNSTDKALFEFANEYAAMTPAGDHIYPLDVHALGGHLINHSCGPNATFKQVERGALMIRAVRPIAIDEEITIHYGWLGVKTAMEKRAPHPCACQAPFCTGTIELHLELVEELIDGEQTVGTRLPPEEVRRRLLADIANDTSENEEALYGYLENGLTMFHGADVAEAMDPKAFFHRLQDAAAEAIQAAKGLPTKSDRRIAQIARRYEVQER